MEKVLRDWKAIVVFIGPGILLYILILLVPMIYSVSYTFYQGSPIFGFEFSGLENYFKMFRDSDFLHSVWVTLKYTFFVTSGQVFFGLLLALLFVFYIKRFSFLIRTLVFFPVVLPTVAVAQMFTKLFEIAPQYGLINSIFNFLQLEAWIQPWLGQPDTAFWVIVIMDVWKAIGFYAVILYAGLIDIPEDLLEAARLDGAKGLKLTQFIILPLVRPILVSAIIFSLNGTLKVFDSIVALTNGGPGNSTNTVSLYMYKTAFTYNDYGYGSTLAVFLLLQCLVITLLVYRFARKDTF